jgi:hypothetical protein
MPVHREPEQLSITKALARQPGTQRLGHQAFLHRVDVGHRHQQKQHQFRKLEYVVAGCLLHRMRHVMLRINVRDHGPNQTRRYDHRLGLAQVGKLLRHHQQTSNTEGRNSGVTHIAIDQ